MAGLESARLIGEPERKPEEKFTSPSGATSRSNAPDYFKCPEEVIEAIIARFEYGIFKGHAEGNWQKGKDDPVFIKERINHAIKHLRRLTLGKGNYQDIEAAACNLAMLCWWEKNGDGLYRLLPDLYKNLEGPTSAKRTDK